MQLQLLELLTPRMEVNATHAPHPLVEADVIKPLKTCARDTLDPVIGNEEKLFPAHEQVRLGEVVRQRKGAVEVRRR